MKTTVQPDIGWAKVDLKKLPNIVSKELPGPKSKEMHARAAKFMKGFSGQVKLFPVCFEKGHGGTLTDVDGNEYIDFSSGIYVTTLGHCHPKVSEAVAKYAKTLMNCHDFTTPIKMRLLEKMAEVLPRRSVGDAALRLGHDGGRGGAAAVPGGAGQARVPLLLPRFPRQERARGEPGADEHQQRGDADGRASTWCRGRTRTGRCGRRRTARSTPTSTCAFYDEFIAEGDGRPGGGVRAGADPGLGGLGLAAGRLLPQAAQVLRRRGRSCCLADEVLTDGADGQVAVHGALGRVPDVVTLGKGFGNGFPVTAMVVREQYGEAVEKISASTQLRRQPDGLRGGAGVDRGDRGGGPARARAACWAVLSTSGWPR